MARSENNLEAGWWRRHGAEVARGTALGLAAIVAYCIFAWEPAPDIKRGMSQEQVIAVNGEPARILEREGHELPENRYGTRHLFYYSGLFKSTETVVTIDTYRNQVINFTIDGDSGL